MLTRCTGHTRAPPLRQTHPLPPRLVLRDRRRISGYSRARRRGAVHHPPRRTSKPSLPPLPHPRPLCVPCIPCVPVMKLKPRRQKIQFVLRQTVYYLRETGASGSTLRPPPVDGIPTPFASTLPPAEDRGGEGVELGLYGSRMEARTLREMAQTLRVFRRQQGGEAQFTTDREAVDGEEDKESIEH